MTSPQHDLLVFGSIVQDLVSYVERFPRPGESCRGKQFKMSCGGKGANQAVMATILGASASMVGRVGNDMFGEANIQSIKSFGTDASLIQKSDSSHTGTATISVNEEGENCIIVTLGANLELSPKRAIEIENEIKKSRLILCQSEVDQEANLEAFTVAKRNNVTTFFNPAPGRPDLDRRILPLTDIICTNENEAEFITGLEISTHEGFKCAAKNMLELGPRIAIVTCGPKGAIIAQRTSQGVTVDTVSAPKVTAVDTTGAGDCFCGSLAYFFCKDPNGDIVKMVDKAVKIAAISVQRHGAQVSYPTREELIKLNLT
ncbi:pfkB family carbohydrate kinase domain-containing protein [Ditylenchus destructor]|uniref:Ribokinase n=1 Tax=Ditylenchus destructor TaxID=166010 RepID=A0AAD4N9M7_9BILA|nr:pfkB family carbohydrate kinase domain-containing protein [Ditylenchus destructor]